MRHGLWRSHLGIEARIFGVGVDQGAQGENVGRVRDGGNPRENQHPPSWFMMAHAQ